MSELLPCPFCSDRAGVYRSECAKFWETSCYTCEASTGNHSTREQAAKAWNTRPTQPDKLLQIDENGKVSVVGESEHTALAVRWMKFYRTGDFSCYCHGVEGDGLCELHQLIKDTEELDRALKGGG